MASRPVNHDPNRPTRGLSRLQLQMASVQRVHCMPAIPEEDSGVQHAADPAQRAKDLLRIALSQESDQNESGTEKGSESDDRRNSFSSENSEQSDYKLKSALKFLSTLTNGSIPHASRGGKELDLENGDLSSSSFRGDSNSKKISMFLHQMTSKVEDISNSEGGGPSASKSFIVKQYNSIIRNFHDGDSPYKPSESGVCGLKNALLATDRLHSSKASFVLPFLSYLLFFLVNIIIIGVVLVMSFVLNGLQPSYPLYVGISLWFFLFSFNIAMGCFPLQVLRSYMQKQKKFQLGTSAADGKVVLVRGVVSPHSRNTIRSEFLDTSGCVLIQTEFKCKEKKKTIKHYYKQTRAVDFYVTDSSSGLSVLVEAGAFLTSGLTVPVLQASPQEVTEKFEMPSPPMFPSSERYQPITRSVELVQYSVRESYLRSGQVATVMGTLHHTQVFGEFVLRPLQERRNISNFILLYGFLPVFYPTWIAGLMVSDATT